MQTHAHKNINCAAMSAYSAAVDAAPLDSGCLEAGSGFRHKWNPAATPETRSAASNRAGVKPTWSAQLIFFYARVFAIVNRSVFYLNM
jgi:hypothetical protein